MVEWERSGQPGARRLEGTGKYSPSLSATMMKKKGQKTKKIFVSSFKTNAESDRADEIQLGAIVT